MPEADISQKLNEMEHHLRRVSVLCDEISAERGYLVVSGIMVGLADVNDELKDLQASYKKEKSE
jgi:cupin superfamily acireductone dioxygenase involved in methionine salvage